MFPFMLNRYRRLFKWADFFAAAWIAAKRFVTAFILSVVFLGMCIATVLLLNEFMDYFR